MQFVAFPVGQKYRVKLDISDTKIPDQEKLEPFLLFNGDTYKPISQYAREPEMFDNIYRGSNWLLSQITDPDKQAAIVKFFAAMNFRIKRDMPKRQAKVPNFAEELGVAYLELAQYIGMLDIFRNYAHTEVTLQDTSKFGTRPQDTKDLTFYEPEMRELMVVALFCKFASPIFGELINNLPEQEDEDGKKKLPPFKESLCSSFLNKILQSYFPDLYNKLQYYIKHIINSMYAKIDDPAATFSGLTPNTRTSHVLSSLLVRNYVLCVLEMADSNIVRYTDTMVRTLTQTQDNTAHKSQVKPRANYGSMSGDESGNMAQMEIDSLVSSSTIDVPVIVEAFIDQVINAFRIRYEITLDEFEMYSTYFDTHPIYQTPLNLFVACAVFGREIGGARGIEMIRASSYQKLIIMLMLIAMHQGYYELARALTATKSTTVKLESALTLEEENFRRQAPVLPNYRACRECFSSSIIMSNDKDSTKPMMKWDKQMASILDDLTLSIYNINLPTNLLDQQYNDEYTIEDIIGRNGDKIKVSTRLTEEACALIATYNNCYEGS